MVIYLLFEQTGVVSSRLTAFSVLLVTAASNRLPLLEGTTNRFRRWSRLQWGLVHVA
jgi:hypothetical protein